MVCFLFKVHKYFLLEKLKRSSLSAREDVSTGAIVAQLHWSNQPLSDWICAAFHGRDFRPGTVYLQRLLQLRRPSARIREETTSILW